MKTARSTFPLIVTLVAVLGSGSPLAAQTLLPPLYLTYQNHEIRVQLKLDRPSHVLVIERTPEGTFAAAEAETTLAGLAAGEHTIVVPQYIATPAQALPPAHFGACWDTKVGEDGSSSQVWNTNCGLADVYPALSKGWAPMNGAPASDGAHALLVVDLGREASPAKAEAILERVRFWATPLEVLETLAKGLRLDAKSFRWTIAWL